MFWSIDLDDFSGKFCNRGKFPLVNAVKNALWRNTGRLIIKSTVLTPNSVVIQSPAVTQNLPSGRRNLTVPTLVAQIPVVFNKIPALMPHKPTALP